MSEKVDSKIAATPSVTSNWILVQENKKLSDAVSIITSSDVPNSSSWKDIATKHSCIILQPPIDVDADGERREACVIQIESLKEKISRIEIVSEASVLEFFKDSGEYAGTEFASLIDEYEDATVYFAELIYRRPTSQASIKLTRIRNSRSNLYLYGMKLVLEREDGSFNVREIFEDILKNGYSEKVTPEKSRLPNVLPMFKNVSDYDENYTTEKECLKSFMHDTWTSRTKQIMKKLESASDISQLPVCNDNQKIEQNLQISIESYIDKKMFDMEERLLQRMDKIEKKTNDKLDNIIKLLEINRNTS